MFCSCIRCREVGAAAPLPSTVQLMHRGYEASGGSEHFLSFEARGARRGVTETSSPSDLLCGFLRLRLPDLAYCAAAPEEELPFPELRGAALVREVHVYGQLIATSDKTGAASQHTGLGRRLLAEAEYRARAHGCRVVAVIAGIGSRDYYRKSGYALHPGEGRYMIKPLGRFAPGWHRAAAADPAARRGFLAALLALVAVACCWLVTAACPAELATGAARGRAAAVPAWLDAPAACLAALVG